MHWNYRIVKHVEIADDNYVYYAIHEVYYDSKDDSEVRRMTLKPISLEAETIIDLQWNLKEIKKAFDKPILDFME